MSIPDRAALAPFATRVPHPLLADYVTVYQGYRYSGLEPGVHHGLPSTALTVVLSFDKPVDVGWDARPASRRLDWAMASGLSVMPAVIHHEGTQHGIQLDLTPLGARALLGVPAAALRRELVSLSDLLGSRALALYDAVAGATTWPTRFAALDRELLALVGTHVDRVRTDATLDHAWRLLHASHGTLSVARLADEVGWSRRQLSARFADEYGIGPKQATRLVRFGVARDLVVRRAGTLSDVAARCGYADQSHLTREWRELAGVPPTAWMREERSFLQYREAGT